MLESFEWTFSITSNGPKMFTYVLITVEALGKKHPLDSLNLCCLRNSLNYLQFVSYISQNLAFNLNVCT